MLPAFRVLAKFKGLRGTGSILRLHRRAQGERALIGEYEGLVDELLVALTLSIILWR